MGRRTVLSLLGLLLLGAGAWRFLRAPSEASGPASAPNRTAAQVFAKKLGAIVLPPAGSTGGQAEFTEAEIDAFLQQEISQHYPQGVKQIHFRFQRSRLSARALVDFNEMQADSAGARKSLVWALLHGERWVEVSGKLTGENGLGRYDILGIRIDDQEIPRVVIDLLLDHYVLPRYPGAGPNTDFDLPFNIRSIELMPGKVFVRYGT
ncbi:MAG: hypothetical protein OXU26_01730 [Acidobacteriota bacterium]|nr:hypothetical protein [Acidobacteriota bacterium]